MTIVLAGLWLLPGLRGRGPIEGNISALAVLPFANLSGDPEQEYFADGMTDELTVLLSNVGALKVISRASSMLYKRDPKPIRTVARELEVDAVVTGSVQRSGGRVRIRAELVSGRSERSLWSDSFERDMSDVLALQRNLALAIVGRIRPRLESRVRARLAAAPRVNAEAHEAYLRARHHWNQFTTEGWQRAREGFQRAIELEPAYAEAYAGLADAHTMLGSNLLTPDEAMPRARAAVRKALELDPDLAAAHASLG